MGGGYGEDLDCGKKPVGGECGSGSGNTQKTMENGYFATAMMKQCSEDVAQEDSMIVLVEPLFMESNVVKSQLKSEQSNRRMIFWIDRNGNKQIFPYRSYFPQNTKIDI